MHSPILTCISGSATAMSASTYGKSQFHKRNYDYDKQLYAIPLTAAGQSSLHVNSHAINGISSAAVKPLVSQTEAILAISLRHLCLDRGITLHAKTFVPTNVLENSSSVTPTTIPMKRQSPPEAPTITSVEDSPQSTTHHKVPAPVEHLKLVVPPASDMQSPVIDGTDIKTDQWELFSQAPNKVMEATLIATAEQSPTTGVDVVPVAQNISSAGIVRNDNFFGTTETVKTSGPAMMMDDILQTVHNDGTRMAANKVDGVVVTTKRKESKAVSFDRMFIQRKRPRMDVQPLKAAKRRRVRAPPLRPSESWGVGTLEAWRWARVISAFLTRKGEEAERLNSHGPALPLDTQRESFPTEKALKKAMQDTYEARNNLAYDVLVVSGIASAIKDFVECMTDATWSDEELGLRRIAEEIRRCWSVRRFRVGQGAEG